MIEFDEIECLKLGLHKFVALHLNHKPIKEMGLDDGKKWLENKYYEFEAKKRAVSSDKSIPSVRKVRKR